MLRFLSFLILIYSSAVYSAVVNKIFIKGNKIVGSRTIRSYISLKEKQTYQASQVKKDVAKLISLGFFDDVAVRTKKTSGNRLNVTYFVKERYLIDKIKFIGNKNIGLDELKEVSTVKKGQFLNFNQLKETFSKIKEEYKNKGYSLVEISHELIPIKKSKKAILNIKINEKQRMLIKRIQFVGNRKVSSEVIKGFIATKEQNITSFFGNSGVYDPDILEQDLQMIEYYYRNKGYLQVHIGRPEVSVTPDRKGIYIHISIKEGSRFRVGELKIAGVKASVQNKIKKSLKLKKGEYFSLGSFHQDVQIIQNYYKDKSYAFAEAEPRIIPDQREENTVHILFNVKKGSSYKVGRIYLKGNHKTRDKVILRQITLREGQKYKESLKQLSLQLIQRLGFFESADAKLKKRGSKTVDVHFDLQERKLTGQAQIGGGYDTTHKIILNAVLKESNFLGLGHSVSLQLNASRFQEILNLTYYDPYFLDTNWNLGFDVFNINQDLINNGNLSTNQRFLSYSQFNTGFATSFGRSFLRDWSTLLKYRFQNQSLSPEASSVFKSLSKNGLFRRVLGGDKKSENLDQSGAINDNYVSFSDIYPLSEGEGLNSSLSTIIEYDRRNDRLIATKGYYGRLSFEYSGLGGDFNYIKTKLNFRYYQPLFWKFVLRSNLNYGTVVSTKKDKKIPFTERFLLGGPDSLRGFKPFSVGLKARSEKAFQYATKKNQQKPNSFKNPESFAWRPYGGSQMFFWNLELQFPIEKTAGVDGVLFFDVGEAMDKLSFNPFETMRLDAGFGVRWRSPFGPLRLDFGFPFKPQERFGEQKMEFQFSIGSSF